MTKMKKQISDKELISKIDSEISKLDKENDIDRIDLLKEIKEKYLVKKLNSIFLYIGMIIIISLFSFYLYQSSQQFDEMFGDRDTKIKIENDSINGIFQKINRTIDESLSGKSITYRVDKNGDIITYNQLIKINDSLELALMRANFNNEIDSLNLNTFKNYSDKYFEILNQYENLKWKYNHVLDTYDIKVNVKEYKKNGKDWISITSSAPKIDSALNFYNKHKVIEKK